MLVMGDKEIQSGKVAVRSRSAGDLGAVSYEEFLAKLKDEVENKK
jgi:threonyl-tRNA synthetase